MSELGFQMMDYWVDVHDGLLESCGFWWLICIFGSMVILRELGLMADLHYFFRLLLWAGNFFMVICWKMGMVAYLWFFLWAIILCWWIFDGDLGKYGLWWIICRIFLFIQWFYWAIVNGLKPYECNLNYNIGVCVAFFYICDRSLKIV